MEKSNSSKNMTGQSKISVKKSDWMIIRWMLIMRPAIVTATLGVAILIIPKDMIDKFPIAVIVFGTYMLTFLYWLAHHFSGIHRPLLATQIAFDIFIITGIIHYTGGIESPFVVLYFLSIMCASLFFRRLVSFLFSTQAAVFYILYIKFYMDSNLDIEGYIVTLQAIMYSVFMYAIGFFSSYYAEKILKKDTALVSTLKLLKEARLDTSDIIQSMTNGLITVNMTGFIVYLNREAEKILQFKSNSAIGRKYNEVFGERAHELVNIIDRGISKALTISEIEIDVFDKNGRPVPLGLTAVPLYDIDKSRRGIIINFKDLTEKNKLIEMIRQSDRMAAIGELSSAIAHEIRNPLASIYNAVELLKESNMENDSDILKLLNVIEHETERLHRISSEFLGFARVKDTVIIKLNLQKIIEEVLILIENDPRNTESVTIKNNIDKNIYIRFDEDHLKQLIINILINSLDALEGYGEIVINVENVKQFDNKYIRLIIYDTGKGFPDEALGHMFEPFFSTKKEGTGLGLALVRKLIISNHGRVLARNKEEFGAEIALDIPLNGV
ncbi:MAG TPA: ATP-binding protein [Anaerolineae bacterium]|nr:ATP-binding protein [Anaerolineae bacterium]